MEIDYTVQIWREGGQFIAHAMPLDVASSGPTQQAARAALDEAVRVRITVGSPCGCASWARDAAPARRRKPLNSIVRWNRMLHLLIRNLDGAVLRRHHLSFGIPDHQPDRVRARL